MLPVSIYGCLEEKCCSRCLFFQCTPFFPGLFRFEFFRKVVVSALVPILHSGNEENGHKACSGGFYPSGPLKYGKQKWQKCCQDIVIETNLKCNAFLQYSRMLPRVLSMLCCKLKKTLCGHKPLDIKQVVKPTGPLSDSIKDHFLSIWINVQVIQGIQYFICHTSLLKFTDERQFAFLGKFFQLISWIFKDFIEI